MQKPIALPLASSLAALFITAAASPLAMAGDSEHSFSGNMTLTSEYVFRGFSQTNDKPALQGGIDYAHSSGAYVGLWASNISWISDSTPGASASLEIDVYAGYGGDIGNGMSYDVGVLTYLYPGNGVATGNADPDTTEVYAALGYEWLTLKYSHSTTSLFGATTLTGGKTSGSGYLELNADYDLGDGLSISAHIGDQKVKGASGADYTDYSLGVSKEMGFGSVGLTWTDTDVEGSNLADQRINASWSMSF